MTDKLFCFWCKRWYRKKAIDDTIMKKHKVAGKICPGTGTKFGQYGFEQNTGRLR